jgi:hypothetical protein
VTERNGNSISADVTEDINENDYDNACFSYFKQFGSCFGLEISKVTMLNKKRNIFEMTYCKNDDFLFP